MYAQEWDFWVIWQFYFQENLLLKIKSIKRLPFYRDSTNFHWFHFPFPESETLSLYWQIKYLCKGLRYLIGANEDLNK